MESNSVNISIRGGAESDFGVVATDDDYEYVDAQLRLPTTLVQVIPDDEEYGWLGDAGAHRWMTVFDIEHYESEARLGLDSYEFAGEVSEEDPSVHISISNPVTPAQGDFSVYSPFDQDDESGYPTIRWGTGEQRDGTPQTLDEVAMPAYDGMTLGATFTSSGLYCFDVTARATLAGGEEVSDTRTIRIAVGDEVAVDAACGTATGEDSLPVPSAPRNVYSVQGGNDGDVHWQAPTRGEVTGYTVTLTNFVDEPLVRTVDAPATTVRFEDVPVGRWLPSVVAQNEHGDSPATTSNSPITVLPAEGESILVNSGHIDGLAPQVDTDSVSGEQSLALRAHHDQYGWLDWDDMVLYSSDVAKTTLPQTYTPAADFSFIGEPGSEVWVSPLSNRDGLPWLGMSTEDEGLVEAYGGDYSKPVGFRIEGLIGPGGGAAPGDLMLGTTGMWENGANLVSSSAEGLPQGFDTYIGNHVHYNWYFTEPGVYCLAVAVDATLPDGQRHTARGLLTHIVGETVDPTTVQPCETTTSYPDVDAPPSVEADPSQPFVFGGGFGNLSLSLEGDILDTNLLHATSYRNAPPRRHDLENVVFRGGVRINGGGGNDGRYYFGQDAQSWNARDEVPELTWNTFGVPQDDIDGNISWSVDEVRGPGALDVVDEGPRITRFDTATGATSTELWTQSGSERTHWWVSEPGKYCVDMTWSARTSAGEDVSVSQTITIVADGPGFTHDEDTLTVTCAGPDPDPVPVAPAAPAAPSAVANGSSVRVSWTAPHDGGSAITGYAVALTPTEGSGGGSSITRHVAGDARSVTFADVSTGTWTATVAAINSVGPSPASPVSEPVTVEAPEPDPVPTTVTAAAAKQVYGKTADLGVIVEPAATGVVEVTVGSRTATAELAEGAATLKLPARQLLPGDHTLDVRYLGVEGEFKPAIATAAVTVAKAKSAVKVKRVKTKGQRSRIARFRITVTADGVKPSGLVALKIAGKSRSVRLNQAGNAVVKVRIPKRVKLGRKPVFVTYRGDRYVAGDKSRATVRITR